MKVVIFCGGFGVRMGEETHRIPKPMLRIGSRPILWHIMRYYASWGHKEFILCLGHRSDVVKEYFLHHDEALTNDFVLEGNGRGARVEVLSGETDDWRITFAETGTNSTIAERLKAVECYLGDDQTFLATYGDGLTDVPLPDVIRRFHENDRMAIFLSVPPQFNAHLVATNHDGTVTAMQDMSTSDVRINGGFFVLKREILNWIEPGDELVDETFGRLIPRGEICAYPYEGFFGPMDTIKDRQRLEELLASGHAPWQVHPSERRYEAPSAA
jgi:glucose-1-phosphate cytidylyltransferase